MAEPNYNISYARWVELGKPGLSYDDWRWWQTGDTSDRKTETDTHSPEYMRAHGNNPADKRPGGETGNASPATWEQRAAAGEFDAMPGGVEAAKALEVQRRRQLYGADPSKLPPDLADIAIRDVATGRLRRARGGSTSSALGLFDPTRSLMGVN